MSVQCLRASSQYLRNLAVPLVSTGFPVSWGMWVNMLSVSAATNVLWALADTATSTNFLYCYINSSEQIGFGANDGTLSTTTLTTNILVAGEWNYLVGRYISNVNRRVSVLYAGGATDNNNNSSLRDPTSLDAMSLAVRAGSSNINPADVLLAEFWYTDTDIQEDGGTLSVNTLRHLAYNGPFSIPHIAKDIIEYRSFRKGIESNHDESDDVYWGGKGTQVWTNTNGPTRGPHPPLSPRYRRPADSRLMVPF